jgi:hypothetical protein
MLVGGYGTSWRVSKRCGRRLHDAGGQSGPKTRCQPRKVLRRAGLQIWSPHLADSCSRPPNSDRVPVSSTYSPRKLLLPRPGFPNCALILTPVQSFTPRAPPRRRQRRLVVVVYLGHLILRADCFRTIILSVAQFPKAPAAGSKPWKIEESCYLEVRAREPNPSPPIVEQ